MPQSYYFHCLLESVGDMLCAYSHMYYESP